LAGRKVVCPLKYHHSMVDPEVTDSREGLQIWREAVDDTSAWS